MSFLAGEVQILPRLDAIQAMALGDRYNLLTAEQNMVQLMAMNHAVSPFDDIRVRSDKPCCGQGGDYRNRGRRLQDKAQLKHVADNERVLQRRS